MHLDTDSLPLVDSVPRLWNPVAYSSGSVSGENPGSYEAQ